MREGDKVSWHGVNRVEQGYLLREMGGGDWYISLPNGRFVLVNEASFISDNG